MYHVKVKYDTFCLTVLDIILGRSFPVGIYKHCNMFFVCFCFKGKSQ